ncbi:hypothetical protein ACFYPX_09015 [Micromonospora zamorensis]|uniref:hypothetical protein n=1 Tax=Micromonospora zamorensis TaxID=709883 RepID=UPI0036D05B7A
MSGLDESDRPADRFDSARRTVLQHDDGGTCLQCADGSCRQQAWAIEELKKHPGGLLLLQQLELLNPSNQPTQEGQPR